MTTLPKTAPLEGQDDRCLMAAAAKGSDAAFGILVDRHHRSLLNLFRRLGADQDEAEDAVQETFLRVHSYRSRYHPTAAFRTFLFTVARRAWLDLCRRRDRHRRREAAQPEVEQMADRPRIGLDERLDLEASLRELPEGQRMVLVLSIFCGLRYSEISTVMEIPEGTVKSRVFHALRKLRRRLSCEQPR